MFGGIPEVMERLPRFSQRAFVLPEHEYLRVPFVRRLRNELRRVVTTNMRLDRLPKQIIERTVFLSLALAKDYSGDPIVPDVNTPRDTEVIRRELIGEIFGRPGVANGDVAEFCAKLDAARAYWMANFKEMASTDEGREYLQNNPPMIEVEEGPGLPFDESLSLGRDWALGFAQVEQDAQRSMESAMTNEFIPMADVSFYAKQIRHAAILTQFHIKRTLDEICSRLEDYTSDVDEAIQASFEVSNVSILFKSKTDVGIRYKDDAVHITMRGFEKYKVLFSSTKQWREESNYLLTFEEALYVFVRRYQSLFDLCEPKKLASNMHASLPAAVHEYLGVTFGVNFECFSSPHNSYFNRFCSAYPDVDWPFGGCDSFFGFQPEVMFGTSSEPIALQMSPPFTEEIFDKAYEHSVKLLKWAQANNRELSIFGFTPDWVEATGIDRMKESTFCTKVIHVAASQHSYIRGSQHQPIDHRFRYYRPSHGSLCIVLQVNPDKFKLPSSFETSILECFNAEIITAEDPDLFHSPRSPKAARPSATTTVTINRPRVKQFAARTAADMDTDWRRR